MAWNPNIPLATDFPSTSQSQINDNWSEIDTLITVDHETFNQAANVVGKHKFVTFTRQGADRATNNPNTNIALYSKVGALSAQSEVYFRRENNGSVIAATESGINSPGWSMLPSGLLMKWGFASVTGQAAFNDTVSAAAGPAFNFIGMVQLTVLNNAAGDLNHAVRVRSFVAGNPSTVNVYAGQRTALNQPTNVTFYWLMFGTRAP